MRLPLGRFCRRLSGVRVLDAAIRRHAGSTQGVPARSDLLAVGSEIHVGFAALQKRMDHAEQLVDCREDADVGAELS